MKLLECIEYDIYIDSQKALSEYFRKNIYSKYIVIVDGNTKRHCLNVFVTMVGNIDLSIIEVKSGEEYKNIETCKYIWEEIIKIGADRHSICINLGGGVIGDMGGYCAATFMRGMDFIQVPTTLLAMVDASVGGKLAIDFMGYKNYIGLYKNPKAVFILTNFLSTLPINQIKSGYAEVIKHALISDEEYWNAISNITAFDNIDWEELIYKSVCIKKQLTEKDPMEKNIRKLLNFGHTIGHAIESYHLMSENKLLHGEAIALGMIVESYISVRMNKLSAHTFDAIKEYIYKFYDHLFPISIDEIAVYNLCKGDKKNKNQEILSCALVGIGKAEYDCILTLSDITAGLEVIKNLK